MFRREFFGQIQRAIGVKRDKDILVEAKYPTGYGVQAAVEIDRRWLAIAVGQAEHFADMIHHNAKRFRARSMPIAIFASASPGMSSSSQLPDQSS